MGEISISRHGGEDLVAVGLGSCIGLALVDRVAGIVGLAHVVLPESREGEGPAGKFADQAVREMISRMRVAGAATHRLEAVLGGGARMFSFSGALDIGARNAAAVGDQLSKARILVRAEATGGAAGRTLRASATDCAVTVKEAGREAVTLLTWTAPASRRRPLTRPHLRPAGAQP
jgi:chemotaxis protein CheD